MAKRDYKAEYRDHQSSPAQIKARSNRNKAARKKKCGPGYEVHHKDGNPNNNAWSNLTCSKKSKNRGRKEASRRKGSKRKAYSSWSKM
tara:strand:+ start:2607 stop:2870 length:264 start_codon:yes stop_codon:yes gene_type:complete